MKCQYRVNSNLMIELEGATEKDLYEAMAKADEVFGSPWLLCGSCKDAAFKPRPVVRVNKEKQKFYELHCTNPECKARFCFGQSKDMKTLFPQREFPRSHPQAGKLKPNGGWVKWRPGDDEDAGTEE
jgi:hypothetical protein